MPILEPRGGVFGGSAQTARDDRRQVAFENISAAVRLFALLALGGALRRELRFFQSLSSALKRLFSRASFGLALLAIKLIIAAVELQPVRVQLRDLIEEREQAAVVADYDQSLLPRGDQVVDGPPRGQVQMISRFVQDQKIRLFEQQPRDPHARHLAAAQALHAPVENDVRYLEFRKDLLDPFPQIPAIRNKIEIARCSFAALDAFERGDLIGEINRVRDGCGRDESRLLRQIRNSATTVDRADRRLAFARENLEKCGLADPVCAHQAGANRAETESEIIEKEAAVRQAIAELDRAQIGMHGVKPLRTETNRSRRGKIPLRRQHASSLMNRLIYA